MAPLGGGVRWQRHEVGGHQASHRAVGVVDDLAHCGLALGVEQREHALAALFRQAVDEGDRVVGVGADDQAADFFIVDQGENVGQQFGRQLFERLGGAARGKQVVEELAHFGWIEPFEQQARCRRDGFCR